MAGANPMRLAGIAVTASRRSFNGEKTERQDSITVCRRRFTISVKQYPTIQIAAAKSAAMVMKVRRVEGVNCAASASIEASLQVSQTTKSESKIGSARSVHTDAPAIANRNAIK